MNAHASGPARPEAASPRDLGSPAGGTLTSGAGPLDLLNFVVHGRCLEAPLSADDLALLAELRWQAREAAQAEVKLGVEFIDTRTVEEVAAVRRVLLP